MDLSSKDVKRALEIVADASEVQGAELEAYLDKVCGDNSRLRKEVLDFLRYDSPHSLIAEQPAGSISVGSVESVNSGRYELGKEIARGGMGVVRLARDTTLGRDVAVKLLHEVHQGNPAYVNRFIREAEISARLQLERWINDSDKIALPHKQELKEAFDELKW